MAHMNRRVAMLWENGFGFIEAEESWMRLRNDGNTYVSHGTHTCVMAHIYESWHTYMSHGTHT